MKRTRSRPTMYVYVVLVLLWGLASSTERCSFNFQDEMALDRNATTAAGATISLIANVQTGDPTICRRSCCDNNICTIALLDAGHNHCFLMTCLPADKCVWAKHLNVTSILIHRDDPTSTPGFFGKPIPDDGNHGNGTRTHSADITSAQDQELFSQLLASTTSANIPPSSNGTTAGAAMTTTTNSAGTSTGTGTTGAGSSTSTSNTGGTNPGTRTTNTDTTSTGSALPGNTTKPGNYSTMDATSQTIIDLALLNNLTDPDQTTSLSREQINELLAKLIVKSGLTKLTKNGAAYTVAQLTTFDLSDLAKALQRLDQSSATLPAVKVAKPLDPVMVDTVVKLARNASLKVKEGKLTREDVDKLLAQLITKYKVTGLTEHGAVTTITHLTEADLETLVHAVQQVNEAELSRNRGDPHSESNQDQQGRASVNVIDGTIKHLNSTSSSDNSRTRNAALITALTIGCVFTVLVFVLVGKRFYDGWERRHYNKIDHLINGIYQ